MRGRSGGPGRNLPTTPADLGDQRPKVRRMVSMIKTPLDEVRSSPLDEAGRRR